jgi:hypothetical protein
MFDPTLSGANTVSISEVRMVILLVQVTEGKYEYAYVSYKETGLLKWHNVLTKYNENPLVGSDAQI